MVSKEIKTISRDELQALVSGGKEFTLVDVLASEHYEQEHIKGAISLPLDEIGKKAKKLLRKDELIVVYCANFQCQASTQAARKLLVLGYRDVRDYKGGLQDYKEAGLPIETGVKKTTKECTACGSA